MPLHRSFRKASLLLVLPLLLNSAVPAFALKTQEAGEGAGAEEVGDKLRQFAGSEEKPLPLAKGVRFLLNNTNPQTVVELPAPYNRRMPMSELPSAWKMEEMLKAVMREANVDGLFLILVPERNTVRVEPPPTDPSRPRWSWPVAQALARYEELTVENQLLPEAVRNFPRPDKVRELLSTRPVPAAQVRAALQQLRQETDTVFDDATRRDKKFPAIYYSRPDNVRQVLSEAIGAVPSPLENARQAGLNLLRAALDYNVPLKVFGSEQAARSLSGTPVPLLNARRVLQGNLNVVLVELEQGGSGALVLQSRQPQDQNADDRLGISALALEARLQRLLAGRPRALVSLTDLSLADLLKELRERGNWESLEIVHEDNPALPLASIAVTQGDAERQFNLSFEQTVPSPEDRESTVFDLSVFQRPDNRVHGKIVLHRFSPAAGAEEQERASREFISRYFAILPANNDGATRREAIKRLVETSAEVSLVGRIKEDSTTGFVHLELPPQLPEVLFEESRRLRPPQVLYDRTAGELYSYTEWGSGKDRKFGWTPVFTPRRALDLTVGESAPGTITISSKRIRNGEIVLLVPKSAPSAGPPVAGAEEEYLLSPEATVLPAGPRSEDWIRLSGEAKVGDLFLFRIAQNISPPDLTYLIRVEASGQLSVLESSFSENRENKGNVVTVSDWRKARSVTRAELKTSYGMILVLQKEGALQINHPYFEGYQLSVNKLQPAAGAEETFEVVVEGVERASMSAGPVELEAVRLRLQTPLDRNIGTRAGLYPDSSPPVLTAFRRAAGPRDGSERRTDLPAPFFALASPAAILALEPTETEEHTNRLSAASLETAIRGALPADLAGRRIDLARYRNLRVDIRSPEEISAGMKLNIAFRPQVVLPAASAEGQAAATRLGEVPANPFKLIFRPGNAGLALLLRRQEVEARIVVGSERQEKVLLEFRPDLAGSIVPGYKFASIDLAVEVARLALGPDATEVQQILDPRDRAILWNQIEAWLRPFPWKSSVTLEDALLNNIVNVLGV